MGAFIIHILKILLLVTAKTIFAVIHILDFSNDMKTQFPKSGLVPNQDNLVAKFWKVKSHSNSGRVIMS